MAITAGDHVRLLDSPPDTGWVQEVHHGPGLAIVELDVTTYVEGGAPQRVTTPISRLEKLPGETLDDPPPNPVDPL